MVGQPRGEHCLRDSRVQWNLLGDDRLEAVGTKAELSSSSVPGQILAEPRVEMLRYLRVFGVWACESVNISWLGHGQSHLAWSPTF